MRKQNLFEDAQCNSNILFIAAGRTAGELFTDFQRKFGYEHVTLSSVEGFDSIEASEFFARMDEDGLINLRSSAPDFICLPGVDLYSSPWRLNGPIIKCPYRR